MKAFHCQGGKLFAVERCYTLHRIYLIDILALHTEKHCRAAAVLDTTLLQGQKRKKKTLYHLSAPSLHHQVVPSQKNFNKLYTYISIFDSNS